MKLTLKATTLAMAMTSTMIGTQAKAQGITVHFAYSCADWAQIRNDGSPTYVSEFWLSGVMTGLALGSGNDLWGSLKQEQVMFWMDRYCDNNPLGQTVIGAAELMTERFGNSWAN